MNWSSIRRTLLLLAVTGALALPAAAELPVQAPLPYNGEFVEVTAANTLRNRYASLDFAKDMAFYLDQATKAAAKTGKTGSMTIKQVLIREIFLVDDAGKPLAVCKLPEGFFTQIAEHEKAFADFVFSSSNGAMKVKFAPAEIVDKVNYTVGKLGANWWFNPKSVEGQLEFLKKVKPGDIDFLFFYLHEANPIDNPKGIISPEYGGMAYGSEEMSGARINTLNDHEIARSVHEWQHHIFDTTIQETEHITVTRGHGLIDAGYAWNALTWGPKFGTLNVGPCLAYYRDCNRYYNRRDMWLRWRLRPAHNIPHEPFSGKAYAWADVTDDMWFKLPQLDSAALRALTGLPMIRVNAPDSALVLDVGTGEGLLSPMLAGEIKTDTTLNNAVNFFEESAAYLRTPTGQWVFVKPQIADVYVDMLALRGKAAKPLVVYGYILEGCKALVAIKLPDDLPVPTDEVSFFRPLPLTVKADGLIAPDDYRFNKSLSIEFGGTPAGASVHYTLDGSDPTEKSPLAKGPIALTDTTTVKARVLGGPADLPYWAKTFVFQPFTAETDGLVKGAGTSFATKAVVRFKTSVAGGAVRYALDGSAPNDKSPAYSAPIEMVKTTTVTARYFDAANKPLGYTWATTFSERNLALSKPVEASGNKNPGERPEFAVDGSTDIGQYWGTIPAPQWIRVDLEKEYSIDRIHIWPYWDGGRYYQYTIEVSTDDKTWTQVVDASKASTPETDKGHLHVIKPTPARYVKVTMLKNSDNPAIHLVELQVFEAPK